VSLKDSPLTEFTRELRSEGLPVAPAVTGDLLSVLEIVDPGNAEDVYWGFRSVVVREPSHVPVFDEVFVRFFGRPMGGRRSARTPHRRRAHDWAL